MHALITKFFSRALAKENQALEVWKSQFIELFSLIGFLTFFITGWIPNKQYNPLVLMWAGVCFAVLGLAFRRGLNWFWAVNLIMLVASCLLLYLIFGLLLILACAFNYLFYMTIEPCHKFVGFPCWLLSL